MDEELKAYLDSMKAEFKAVRAEIQSVGTGLGAEIQSVGTGLGAEIQSVRTGLKEESQLIRTELKAHVSEECEKVETKLLTEFWKWGRTSDMRTRQALAETSALSER